MEQVSRDQEEQFFKDVEAASQKAVWCAVANVTPQGPRVRIVHPTWEGKTLWFATGSQSPKVAQLRADPWVDVQYQVSPPDFVHVLVRGTAQIETDPGEKRRVWDLLDYDLSQFFSGGPEDGNYTPVKITPHRVELSRMFGMENRRIWRRAG